MILRHEWTCQLHGWIEAIGTHLNWEDRTQIKYDQLRVATNSLIAILLRDPCSLKPGEVL
jgi:hypothetical protein